MFFKKAHKALRSRYFWGVLGIVPELVQLLAKKHIFHNKIRSVYNLTY